MIYSCRRTQRKLEALKHYKNTSGRFIHIKQTECGRLIPLYDLLLFDHRQRPRRAQRFSELWLDTSKARVSHVYIYIRTLPEQQHPGLAVTFAKASDCKSRLYIMTYHRTCRGSAYYYENSIRKKKTPPIHIHTRTPSSMVVFFTNRVRMDRKKRTRSNRQKGCSINTPFSSPLQ